MTEDKWTERDETMTNMLSFIQEATRDELSMLSDAMKKRSDILIRKSTATLHPGMEVEFPVKVGDTERLVRGVITKVNPKSIKVEEITEAGNINGPTWTLRNYTADQLTILSR